MLPNIQTQSDEFERSFQQLFRQLLRSTFPAASRKTKQKSIEGKYLQKQKHECKSK